MSWASHWSVFLPARQWGWAVCWSFWLALVLLHSAACMGGREEQRFIESYERLSVLLPCQASENKVMAHAYSQNRMPFSSALRKSLSPKLFPVTACRRTTGRDRCYRGGLEVGQKANNYWLNISLIKKRWWSSQVRKSQGCFVAQRLKITMQRNIFLDYNRFKNVSIWVIYCVSVLAKLLSTSKQILIKLLQSIQRIHIYNYRNTFLEPTWFYNGCWSKLTLN